MQGHITKNNTEFAKSQSTCCPRHSSMWWFQHCLNQVILLWNEATEIFRSWACHFSKPSRLDTNLWTWHSPTGSQVTFFMQHVVDHWHREISGKKATFGSDGPWHANPRKFAFITYIFLQYSLLSRTCNKTTLTKNFTCELATSLPQNRHKLTCSHQSRRNDRTMKRQRETEHALQRIHNTCMQTRWRNVKWGPLYCKLAATSIKRSDNRQYMEMYVKPCEMHN